MDIITDRGTDIVADKGTEIVADKGTDIVIILSLGVDQNCRL